MKIKRYTAGPFLTNTYLIINNDEALVVDPTIGLDKYINDINNYKIKGVLLTHGHIDHIATVNLFDCKVYIYEDEVNKLYNNHLNLCDMFGYDFQFENHEIVKLKNNDVILFSGKEIKVIHTPGHTNGSISFVIDNMIFTGDTLFQMSVGRTDFPTGNAQELKKSVNMLIDEFSDNTIIYPGHGEATTIADERHNPFL